MKTDVVIIGGGPGGATAAQFLAREGINSIIIEKEAFPRYHIGESMTGECGAIVRELGLEEEMLRREHPLKYGVTVYGQNGKNSWWVPVMKRDENDQLQENFTWQVRRSDFDAMMLERAVAMGARLIPGRATSALLNDDGSVRGVTVRTEDGSTVDIEAEVVLDCSGQATFLANAGVAGPKYRGNYDRQIAIYSQVTGAIRDDGDTPETYKDNTLIFYQKKYHWSWFIPLDKEVVSVGVTVPAQYFLDQKEEKLDFLRRELQNLNPALSWRMKDFQFVEEARATVNYSYQVRNFAGKGYICVGDAHRFIDPIFSFGLYVTMKEAEFATQAIKAYMNGAGRDAVNPFADYMIFVEKGIDVLEDALDAFWEQPLAFAAFVHRRYREQMVDVFAGRIYDDHTTPAANAFRAVLKRERTYDADGLFSVPIGSRYHAERAPIWQAQPAASPEPGD